MKIYNKEKNIVLWDTILDQEYMGYANEDYWIEGEYGDYDLYDGKTIEEYKENYIKEHNYQKLDLSKGYLKEDEIITHYPEVKAVEGKGHYETIKEYASGGKDVKWVVDVESVDYQPARDEEEIIQVYIPYTEEEILENKKNELRNRREVECFPIINRGKLWYDTLTQEQLQELTIWYELWLDVTTTLIVPLKPIWLK